MAWCQEGTLAMLYQDTAQTSVLDCSKKLATNLMLQMAIVCKYPKATDSAASLLPAQLRGSTLCCQQALLRANIYIQRTDY